MRLPNKLYTYQESQLPLFPVFLEALSQGSIHPTGLYEQVRSRCQSVSDFTEVLDALYALNVVTIDQGSGELTLVN